MLVFELRDYKKKTQGVCKIGIKEFFKGIILIIKTLNNINNTYAIVLCCNEFFYEDIETF